MLLIEARADGVFLERFSVDADFGGDTWHETVEDAKHQAVFEYGEAVVRVAPRRTARFEQA